MVAYQTKQNLDNHPFSPPYFLRNASQCQAKPNPDKLFTWLDILCRTYGEIIPSPVPGKSLLTVREPLGVAALITPWNFPIGMPARKVGCEHV